MVGDRGVELLRCDAHHLPRLLDVAVVVVGVVMPSMHEDHHDEVRFPERGILEFSLQTFPERRELSVTVVGPPLVVEFRKGQEVRTVILDRLAVLVIRGSTDVAGDRERSRLRQSGCRGGPGMRKFRANLAYGHTGA